jgi:hypothetical protein
MQTLHGLTGETAKKVAEDKTYSTPLMRDRTPKEVGQIWVGTGEQIKRKILEIEKDTCVIESKYPSGNKRISKISINDIRLFTLYQ